MSRQKNFPAFSNDILAPRNQTWSRRLRGLGSLLLLTLVAGQAGAQENDLTVRNLHGHWGFSGSGVILPPATPAETPMAVTGIMTFENLSRCAITDTLNIGGSTISRTSKSCAYTVNPDGSGSLEAWFPGDPGPTPLSFVLVDDQNEMYLIGTSVMVGGGIAKRQ